MTVPDGDGLYRLVIARSDPGVANWLDTGGARHVFAFVRWQGLPPGAPPPHLKLTMTTLDKLDDLLPADTRRVSPEERKAAIAARQAAYARRITP